ncbi:hypothetical protein FACS1894151_04410 [Spirochaetia bacterium]|nr:hypothetical protein FACS1894151_04410 [Spirochaetia bacterium]
MSAIVFSGYPDAAAAAAGRSAEIIQVLIAELVPASPYVPFVTMAASAVYALGTLITIYFFFEKTHSVEILFFVFFALSLSFETARIIAPFCYAAGFPQVYMVIAARFLLFGRCFGVFSLFTASIYAAGMQMQKQSSIILVMITAGLIIALGIPIDGFSWDSSLAMVSGYSGAIRLVEFILTLISAAGFFVAAWSRASKEYVFVGIGSVLVLIGRNLLINADNWVTPLPGLLLLVAGTYLICSQLHKVYLWL